MNRCKFFKYIITSFIIVPISTLTAKIKHTTKKSLHSGKPLKFNNNNNAIHTLTVKNPPPTHKCKIHGLISETINFFIRNNTNTYCMLCFCECIREHFEEVEKINLNDKSSNLA